MNDKMTENTRSSEPPITTDDLSQGAVLTDSRFSRFDQELIDKYFNDDGKAAIEALIASKVREARVDELETIKKLATEHCAFKIDQYGSDLDTKDVRLAVPNKKIDERLKALQSREQDKV